VAVADRASKRRKRRAVGIADSTNEERKTQECNTHRVLHSL
jgi:hypothetical protein